MNPPMAPVAHTEQQAAMEYAIPCFVISDDVWEKNGKKSPAFSAGGQVYLRETLPEEKRGMFTPHEATHVMKQTGFKPYLDFVERTCRKC